MWLLTGERDFGVEGGGCGCQLSTVGKASVVLILNENYLYELTMYLNFPTLSTEKIQKTLLSLLAMTTPRAQTVVPKHHLLHKKLLRQLRTQLREVPIGHI